MNEDYTHLWIFLCDKEHAYKLTYDNNTVLIHNNDIISLKFIDTNIIELIYYYNPKEFNAPNTLNCNKNYFVIEDRKLNITYKYSIKDWYFRQDKEKNMPVVKVILNQINK